jgi:hypothetical protein
MKPICTAVFAAALLGAGGGAQAAGIGLRAGTTGIGGDVAFSVLPTLSARIGYSAMSFDTTIDETDIDYDGDVKLSNLNLLLDFTPLGPVPFRITAGFIVNDNEVDLHARTRNGTLTINGVVYPVAQLASVTGTIKPGNRAAPYLGIGYGNVAGFGVNFYFDLGVMFQGTPEVRLSSTCNPPLTPAQCSRLASAVTAEQARLQGEVSSFKYYPVANIGVTIGF